MAIDLYDALNGNGLFQIQGKGFHAIDVLNAARLTTVPVEVEDFLAQHELLEGADLNFSQVTDGVAAAVKAWISAGSTLAGAIRTACERLLIEAVAADAPQPTRSLTRALEYLVRQMETGGDHVDANTVGLSLVTGGGNVGDVAICYTTARGDGKAQQNLCAESIDVEVTSEGSSTPSITFLGDAAETNRLSEAWPKGSGCSTTLAATDAADSLLSNGDFEDTAQANVPDDWIIATGAPGTSITVTNPEIQTVAISGSPTGGHYFLYYTNSAGIKRATVALAHNASGSTVQAALRAIAGLERATVSMSGTSPNFTHTVTLHGVAGDPAQLTSKSNLIGGTITHATTLAGNAHSFKGRTLKIQGNGSELTTLYHPLSRLLAETVYFVHFRVKRTQSGPSGLSDELRVEIVDAIDGSVTTDPAGTSNSLVIDAKATSIALHESKWFSFRLRRTTTQPVYLRLRISSPLAADAALYIDEVAVAAGRELYKGGPYVAAFAGAMPAALEDSWVLTATNDGAGAIQTWYHRSFDMAGKNLLLPTTGAGVAIPDTVIG